MVQGFISSCSFTSLFSCCRNGSFLGWDHRRDETGSQRKAVCCRSEKFSGRGWKVNLPKACWYLSYRCSAKRLFGFTADEVKTRCLFRCRYLSVGQRTCGAAILGPENDTIKKDPSWILKWFSVFWHLSWTNVILKSNRLQWDLLFQLERTTWTQETGLISYCCKIIRQELSVFHSVQTH